ICRTKCLTNVTKTEDALCVLKGPHVTKHNPKPALVNLSVEEENLAAIPFAVLERRVGKRIGKIEIKGTKVLPNGSEMEVVWQIQGNNELGLPTEQDLDIFVVLGVLTFRNNFAKTVTFSGREIARMLNIHSVHGKFYQRLKLAMDRFIPLRFRPCAGRRAVHGARRNYSQALIPILCRGLRENRPDRHGCPQAGHGTCRHSESATLFFTAHADLGAGIRPIGQDPGARVV